MTKENHALARGVVARLVAAMRQLGIVFLFISVSAFSPAYAAGRPPNIVLILTDDLGYGDVGVFNPASKIPTPNIDRLAQVGMRFTDAHAAPTCTPARYSLLTGRYMFRVPETTQDALVEPEQVTLGSLLKQAGYATAMIGKWDLRFKGVGFPPDISDYTKALLGGPVDHGFDTYYGIPTSPDVAPYFFIQNDRIVQAATDVIPEHHSLGLHSIQGLFWRGGAIAPDFKHDKILPQFAYLAVSYIQSRRDTTQPFFLYFAPPAPHTPWVASEKFRNKSGAGMYGDYVMQVDDVVGQVTAALSAANIATDTLVIVSSDNGPTWFPEDVQKYGHSAAGPWRGMKGDAWEGGHRVPFIASWPGKVPAGASSGQLIALTDMLATFAAITGQHLAANAGEDSFNLLPLLLGKSGKSPRRAIVHEAVGGVISIRQKNWKLIPSSCAISLFEGIGNALVFKNPCLQGSQSNRPDGQLYDLTRDPGEENNLYAERPEIVQRLARLLAQYRRDGRSRPK